MTSLVPVPLSQPQGDPPNKRKRVQDHPPSVQEDLSLKVPLQGRKHVSPCAPAYMMHAQRKEATGGELAPNPARERNGKDIRYTVLHTYHP